MTPEAQVTLLPQEDLALPSLPLQKTDSLNNSLHADRYAEHPSVQKWIAFYANGGKKRFEQVLKRGNLYKKQIHSILKKFRLPTNFYYLALIESEFKVEARSPVQATGIWQFMLPTARSYGLRINEYIDERRDPWRSTVAAALYLKNLNNVFDSWFLAMSAYNAGESRIMNAIIRSGTRDFWKLSQVGFIPRETREYVPRFLAALIVGEHPERYGINVENSVQPNVVAVSVPSPVRLEALAQIAGLSVDELKMYNPHILKGCTPPRFDSYRIWLPEGKSLSQEALAQLELIPASQIRSSPEVKHTTKKMKPKHKQKRKRHRA
jgi:membrane-bound lytic murein transglycosylase D